MSYAIQCCADWNNLNDAQRQTCLWYGFKPHNANCDDVMHYRCSDTVKTDQYCWKYRAIENTHPKKIVSATQYEQMQKQSNQCYYLPTDNYYHYRYYPRDYATPQLSNVYQDPIQTMKRPYY